MPECNFSSTIVTLIFDDNFLNNLNLIKFLPNYFLSFNSNQLLKFCYMLL